MSGYHNLVRMTAAANTIEAWRDWHTLAHSVTELGHGDLAEKHWPPQDAGWRVIDKCITALRNELGLDNPR